MSTTEPTVVSANLVLVGANLLEDPNAFGDFRVEFDPDMQTEFGMVTEVPSGVTEPSRKVNLNRDRIVLHLSASRSSIVREYPAALSDLGKLSEVAWSAIRRSKSGGKEPRAFGFNIELVYDQNSAESALQYLGSRLFKNLSLGKEDWRLTGGTGTVIFTDSGSRQWILNVRQRPGDDSTSRVFLGLNLHNDVPRMPEEEEITQSLEDLWVEAHRIVNQLDEIVQS